MRHALQLQRLVGDPLQSLEDAIAVPPAVLGKAKDRFGGNREEYYEDTEYEDDGKNEDGEGGIGCSADFLGTERKGQRMGSNLRGDTIDKKRRKEEKIRVQKLIEEHGRCMVGALSGQIYVCRQRHRVKSDLKTLLSQRCQLQSHLAVA